MASPMTAPVRRTARRPMASLRDVTFDPSFDAVCLGPVKQTVCCQVNACLEVLFSDNSGLYFIVKYS